MRSRKSSSPRRQTRSVAITLPFGVRISASQDSAARTSLETIRWSRSAASGPCTRTHARGRTYAFVATDPIGASVGRGVPVEGRKEGSRGWDRPGAAATRPAHDREVARAPRGHRAARRPRDVAFPHLGRGRAGDRARLGAVQRAPALEQHAGHPLRDPLEPLRHVLRGGALARAREALPPAAGRPLRRRLGRARLQRQRAAGLTRGRPRPPRDPRRRRAAHARPRLPPPPRRPGQVLLEERQVAQGHRASRPRPARLLGALRLLERRRPLDRSSATPSEAAGTDALRATREEPPFGDYGRPGFSRFLSRRNPTRPYPTRRAGLHIAGSPA